MLRPPHSFIGIALLAISGVIFIGENNYVTINTNINYLNCNSVNCLLGVQFTANGNIYKKDFYVDMNYVRPENNQVTITYEISNPNNNYIGASNYNTIMYILIAIGIFFISLWYYLSSKKDGSIFSGPSLSIYTQTETPSEMYKPSKN